MGLIDLWLLFGTVAANFVQDIWRLIVAASY